MNNDNGFDLLIDVVFGMGTQIGRIVPKHQDLVISFSLGEGENIPKFHLRALQIRGENFLLQDKTGQINNLTGKYIMKPTTNTVGHHKTSQRKTPQHLLLSTNTRDTS